MSENYNKINKTMDKINSVYGDRSYESIDKLTASGELNKIIIENGADEAFKNILVGFFDIIKSSKLVRYPYRRKIELYTRCELLRCFCRYGYEFSNFFGDVNAFISFPLFIKIACEYYNINHIASMSLEELDYFLSNEIDMAHTINQNIRVGREDKSRVIINKYGEEQTVGEYEIMPVIHKKENKILYDTYEKNIPFEPSLEIPIKAEHLTYYYLGKGETIWVAKDCGDGYGYDVINVDKSRKKETLAETKTTHNSENFKLTRVEHKVMLESADCPHTIYKIFKFNLDTNNRIISFRVYVYDKDNNVLIDTLDDTNICNIVPRIDENFNKVEFVCVYQKIKKPKKETNN